MLRINKKGFKVDIIIQRIKSGELKWGKVEIQRWLNGESEKAINASIGIDPFLEMSKGIDSFSQSMKKLNNLAGVE